MSSMTIRLATPSDKEAVLGIHDNVYDGLDYLAGYYDEFLSCPFTAPYVAIIDNQIVAFVAAFIIDGGETVITRAGRINPRVNGKGLFGQLVTHVLLASGASTHAFVTSNTNPFANKESFRAINKLISEKSITRYVFGARSLQTLQNSGGELRDVSDEEMKFYFNDSNSRRYLFPNDRVIVDWVPYRVIEANLPLIKWSGKRTKIFSDVSLQNDGKVKGLLSFSTTFPAKRSPFCCNLNIYGTDTSALKDHVVAHIRHIGEVTDDVVTLLVLVERDFDMSALEKTFEEIGLRQSEWCDSEQSEGKTTHQFLFEKVIKV